MNIKKEITFIYYDSSDKSLYEPIAEEAKKRGYNVKFTNKFFEKCEIGVYCQHVNFPENSKFSIIMLHDMTQHYAQWPDIWFMEPWNIYDVGILPSKQWVDNWNKCSGYFYTNPRKGVYEIGWPKADVMSQYFSSKNRKEIYKKLGMDPNKKTILYAPSWENDNKQDDFVQSMLKLDVNILIKQGPWSSPIWMKTRPDQYENILKMKELHKDIPSVTILDEKSNIYDAIALADVLVSEESSTMCEALLAGIPSVSVSNWLIPDEVPSRYPNCIYKFAIETKKEELTECISNIINKYDYYKKQAEDFSKSNFSNVGKTSSMIVDIIDDCVNGKDIRYDQLKKAKKKKISFSLYIKHYIARFRTRWIPTACKNSKLITKLLELYRNIRYSKNK